MTSGFFAAENGEPRSRVIMSAYACGPVAEPEAAAGWAFASAAAQDHEVTVITRTRFRESIESALANDTYLATHLHPVFIDLPPVVMTLRRRLPGGLYWYYALWQRKLLATARQLHGAERFRIAHHVTFANDWMSCGLSRLGGVRFVWGPVGGASRLPWWKLRRWLGPRGTATEIARTMLTGALRAIWGDAAARRSDVLVAQNPDVAARFRGAKRVVVEPNACIDARELPARSGERGSAPVAVFAGRILAWKGARLAVATLAQPSASEWRLRIIGDGYDRSAVERLAVDLGLRDRVTFLGHIPRDEVLREFAEASAMLFPSMHDQAGWVAAEASAMGCPVVVLPLGGPQTLADRNAFVASTAGDVPENLARQLNAARGAAPRPHDRWSPDRLPALLADWYGEA